MEIFGRIISEWNPCFSDDGFVRFTWDQDVGAHDVEVEARDPDVKQRDELSTFTAGDPERVRLRVVLEEVLDAEARGEPVDLESVRRLVAALGEGPNSTSTRKQVVTDVSALRHAGEIKAYIDLLFLAIVILLCIAKIVTN